MNDIEEQQKLLNEQINIMFAQFIDAINVYGKEQKLKSLFDPNESFEEIIVKEDMKNLINISFKTFSDGNIYYLVDDNNIIVFMGYIDNKEVVKTIDLDIRTLYLFIKFVIAVILENNTYLERMKNNDEVLEMLSQFYKGQIRLKSNHPEISKADESDKEMWRQRNEISNLAKN